jgi:hypothetical protein
MKRALACNGEVVYLCELVPKMHVVVPEGHAFVACHLVVRRDARLAGWHQNRALDWRRWRRRGQLGRGRVWRRWSRRGGARRRLVFDGVLVDVVDNVSTGRCAGGWLVCRGDEAGADVRGHMQVEVSSSKRRR